MNEQEARDALAAAKAAQASNDTTETRAAVAKAEKELAQSSGTGTGTPDPYYSRPTKETSAADVQSAQKELDSAKMSRVENEDAISKASQTLKKAQVIADDNRSNREGNPGERGQRGQRDEPQGRRVGPPDGSRGRGPGRDGGS